MKFLGVVEGRGLYAKWNEKHNQIRYCIDGEDVAVYGLKSMTLSDKIIFRNNTLANELSGEAKDQIQTLAREIDVKELQEQEKDIDEYRHVLSVALGVDEKDLISYTEVNLDEKVQEKEKNIEKEERVATKKDINAKQEISLDAMATDMKTLGQVLQKGGKIPNIEGKKFTKLLVVESNDVKNIDKNAKINSSRLSFVLEASDGSVMPIDLEQDRQEGNNPREISHRTKADGRVEQDDVNCRYKTGDGDSTLSIKFSNGPGNIEIGYSAHKTIGEHGIEGNVSIDHELQTSTVYWEARTDSRDRELSDGYRGTEDEAREAKIEEVHNSSMKRGNKGIVDPNDNEAYKNDDGDPNTKAQEHQKTIEQIVEKLMENDDVEGLYTEEKLTEMLQEAHDKGENLEEKAKEIEEDAERLPSHNR